MPSWFPHFFHKKTDLCLLSRFINLLLGEREYFFGPWFLNYDRAFYLLRTGAYLSLETVNLQLMYWPSFSDWKIYPKFKKIVFKNATQFILFWDIATWWYEGNPGIKIHNHSTSAEKLDILYIFYILQYWLIRIQFDLITVSKQKYTTSCNYSV